MAAVVYNNTTALLAPKFGWSSFFSSGNMPSIRNIAFSALGGAQSVLGLWNSVARDTSFGFGASETCTNPQLSCHNTSAVENLCCFNYPGGALLQTQFWDTNPSTGPSDSWTIHGLWPDNCDGTYQSNCDDSRAYTNITAILKAFNRQNLLDYMNTYWISDDSSNEVFWEHEWGKHGTCISTLDPQCYTDYQPTEEVPDFFNRTVSLFQSLPTYTWLSAAGITPSTSKTYTASAIQSALSANRDGHQVYLGCNGDTLDEVWYYFNVLGSVQTGTFEASSPIGSSSSCPSSGIKYLPKSSSSGGGGLTSTATSSSISSTSTGNTNSTISSRSRSSSSSTSPSPTSTKGAFSGKGYLNVITDGNQDGCIISYGTWFTTGTCATFHAAAASDSSFTLSSSKGSCAVSSGKLTCSSSVSRATEFSADGDLLVYDGRSTFGADGVPTGSEQGTVYMDGRSVDTSLMIEWQTI